MMIFMDPISDTLVRIHNASLLKKSSVNVRYSKFIVRILQFLYTEGYIRGFAYQNDNSLRVLLKYINNTPLIIKFKMFSSPGRRIYYSSHEVRKFMKNKKSNGHAYIFSTNQGLLTLSECLTLKIGGLLLFRIL